MSAVVAPVRVVVALATGVACVACSTNRPRGLEASGDARVFLPGVVSSAYSEIRAAPSPDGDTVLWGSTNRPGGPGGWDIWMTRRGADGWSAPVAVAFDTPANEFDPAFSADGRRVFFFSNRDGGLGGDDIWQVDFDPRTAAFGSARNPGAAVNSAGNEWAPSPTPDGRHLLFATDGRGGAGRHDLFVSDARGSEWAPARSLAGDLQTAGDDFDAAWLDGGRALVFARSDDVATLPITLWIADCDALRCTQARPLGAAVNGAGSVLGPSADPRDPGVLLFSGERPDGRGLADILSIRVHAGSR